MDCYKNIIHKSKKSIDSFFGSESPSPESKRRRGTVGARSSCFKVTEQIYSEERNQFMQEVKLLSVPKSAKTPYRHVRVRKSFAKDYSRRRTPSESNSLSPAKFMSANHSLLNSSPESPEMRRSGLSISVSSPSRPQSLPRGHRSFHLHTIMDICDQVRGQPKVVSEVRRQQSKERQLQCFIAKAEEALEEVKECPCEVLEPLYRLKRDADSYLQQDAVQMVRDERDNVDEAASQIKMMIARSTQLRRSHG